MYLANDNTSNVSCGSDEIGMVKHSGNALPALSGPWLALQWGRRNSPDDPAEGRYQISDKLFLPSGHGWRQVMFSLSVLGWGEGGKKEREKKDFSGGPVVDSAHPLQGARVRSLVGELRSHTPCSVAKKRKKKKKRMG